MEDELQRLRNQAKEQQRQIEEQKRQLQRTTLPEYLVACHSLVFSRLVIQDNRALSSTGSITNPRDKWCPTTIQPWSEFLNDQSAIHGTLYSTFPLERRVSSLGLFFGFFF